MFSLLEMDKYSSMQGTGRWGRAGGGDGLGGPVSYLVWEKDLKLNKYKKYIFLQSVEIKKKIIVAENIMNNWPDDFAFLEF